MKMLVANVGSSSFKCQLLDMPAEKVLAKAKVERVKTDNGMVEWSDKNGNKLNATLPLPTYKDAISFVLDKFTDSKTGVLSSLDELDSVAFKPVYAKGISGCQYMDDRVLAAMAEYNSVIAPMHNPAYIDAIGNFRAILPNTPLVGLFEDSFFDKLPDYVTIYPIPWDWTEKYNIRKRLFHSASHSFVINRVAELMGRDRFDLNLITCHLGGSSSIMAIKNGEGIDGTGGFSLQNGVANSVRPGDLDPFLLSFLVSRGEGTVDEVIEKVMTEGGLAGISGIGFDMRDLQKGAEEGNARAKLAIDVYVHGVKKYIGSWLAVLGHVDAMTMQGGTGEASVYIRELVLSGLEEYGIVLDKERNAAAVGKEAKISADNSKIEIWVVPTDEEIVVARECYRLLAGK